MSIENQTDAIQLVEESMGHFRDAVTAAEPVIPMAHALDTLMRASTADADLASLAPDVAREAPGLISAIAPRVAEAVAASIAPDRVYFALGAASALLTVQPNAFHVDRLLYVGLLLANLRGFLCRSELDRRGDPLMKNIREEHAGDPAVGQSPAKPLDASEPSTPPAMPDAIERWERDTNDLRRVQ
ncbi:hypothetical protein [Rhizobium leguminosarum]|uniref:hypothetical protein n=1 Tax=Rhizobium leguminosarum TaxID=384 RepID=UPI001C8FFC04|nr:hypothetical protein [Rhizobium leguminosarum]MBY2969508.1 hypothetical protein [Rhizobium leguminosarum]MBY2976881.1 hypothetical protein [Rhizobium leguminosarum]MBY3005432.1 hypothetical protein [Rhizobium leguminosarum]